MSDVYTDGFLTRFESLRLQEMFETWIQMLKPEMLYIKLFEVNLLSRYEYENLQAMKSSYDKAEFLFHKVLMKATYSDLCKIRRILLESRQSAHKQLAKLMPDRGENLNFDEFDYVPVQQATYQKQNQSFMPTSNYKESSQRNVTTQHVHTNDVDMADDVDQIIDLLELEDDGEYIRVNIQDSAPSSSVTDAVAQQAAGSSRKKPIIYRIPKSSLPAGIAKCAANPDYRNYTGALPCYDVKPKNKNTRQSTRATCGKGLCVVIRNFSDDLTGYERDEQVISDFFQNTLGYDVWAGKENNMVDLCQEQFEQRMAEVKTHLQNPQSCSDVDRFFLFILSHGDEVGVKMCARGSTRDEEEIDGMPVRIPIEQIVRNFTHDKISLLKSFPKCFYIQACQGTEVAKPAASADKSQMKEPKEDLWKPPTVPTVIGSDVLVCLPSEKGTYSWVPSTGSWFIQETIALFKNYYKTEHLVDIMNHVNHVLSQKHGKGQVADGDDIIQVRQMPGLSCTLTKKFYMSIPQNT